MLRRIKSSNSLDNIYDVEFYDYEKIFNAIPTEEEEEEIVEEVHIIYDGGGVMGYSGGCTND